MIDKSTLIEVSPSTPLETPRTSATFRDDMLGNTNAKSTDAMRNQSKEFAALKKLIKEQGLLEKQIPYYTVKILATLALLVVSIGILATVHNVWLQLANAMVFAFLSTQFGFLGHDAGHRQIARLTRNNDILGLLMGNLIVGMSFSWWLDKHNRHHSNPNQMDHDPDINVPIIAFDPADARDKTGFQRFMVRHQAFFFFPVLTLVAIDLQINSVKYLLQNKSKYRAVELALLVAHHALYFGALFTLLPVWEAVVFIAVHQVLFGLYLGTTFAPNHKGMPIIASGSKMDFLHQQVITSRNIHANPFNDFWYGGLNYQIEHHLFPTLPRNQMKAAHAVIRRFCEEQEIGFYETGIVQSFREILAHLAEVSQEVR